MARNPGLIDVIPSGWSEHEDSIDPIDRIYCDGHIEADNMNKRITFNDAFVSQWNIDNEPHREAFGM